MNRVSATRVIRLRDQHTSAQQSPAIELGISYAGLAQVPFRVLIPSAQQSPAIELGISYAGLAQVPFRVLIPSAQ